MSETKPPKSQLKLVRKSTSIYTPEIARRMCEQLSDGIPLRQICRQEGFPAWQTVYEWMAKDPELHRAIAHAREVGQDAIAEEIYRLVEAEPSRIFDEKGNSRVDAGHVAWIRVQADIKLKLLAKWNPKRYGDRVEVSGDAQNPLVIKEKVTIFDQIMENTLLARQLKQKSADEPTH